MIHLIIDNFGGKLDIRVHFTCPNCGRITWFAASSPYHCDRCYEILPNMASMIRDKDERLEYHRRGRTRSIDRYVSRDKRWKVPAVLVWPDETDEQIKNHMYVL